MRITPLPETANDNHLILPTRSLYGFDHGDDRYALNILHEDDLPEPLDLLDDTMDAYYNLPRWNRAQIEASVPKPKIILRDAPAIETVEYLPERSDGAGLIQVASLQPHHRMSETIEKSRILFYDTALASSYDWEHFLDLRRFLRNRVIILACDGNYIDAGRLAIEFALNGQDCFWIEVGNQLGDWMNCLKTTSGVIVL